MTRHRPNVFRLRRLAPWLLALCLAACHPLAAVDGCTPGHYACRSGRPAYCTSSQRWAPTMASCPGGTVCAEGVAGVLGPAVATCVPVTAADGGAL